MKYRFSAKGENTLDTLVAYGKVSWLFHLISGSASYEHGELKWKLRLAWKKFDSSEEEQKETSETVSYTHLLTGEDLQVFRLLIGVSGIGPKAGLNILSCLSPDELRFAVLAGDVKTISSAPGIGKKTAEKLILELKDKMSIEDVLEQAAHGSEQSKEIEATDTGMQAEAVQALTALGYGLSLIHILERK